MIETYKKGDIFEIRNPCWYADIFIFNTERKYISVNCRNKIESIGTDIEERFEHTFGTFDNILKHSSCKIATKRHKRMLKMIDDEYFAHLDSLDEQFYKLRNRLFSDKR